MFDQLFESFRKASESSLQAQQDMFKQWVQQWPSAPLNTGGASAEWREGFQKRLLETSTETLNKHRELIDATYKAGIQAIEQTFRVTEAKSPEDYRRMVEDLWRRLSETFKQQAETQFRDFQKTTERWMELAQKAKA